MKKGIILMVLATLVAGGVFAQEKYDGSFKNTVMGRVELFGAGASYERAFNQNFSAGVEANYNAGLIAVIYGFDVFGRWYPWGKTFYAELGLGFGITTPALLAAFAGDSANVLNVNGFLIKPGVGWKIDIGKPGAWVLQPSVGLELVIGELLIVGFPITFGIGYTF